MPSKPTLVSLPSPIKVPRGVKRTLRREANAASPRRSLTGHVRYILTLYASSANAEKA